MCPKVMGDHGVAANMEDRHGKELGDPMVGVGRAGCPRRGKLSKKMIQCLTSTVYILNNEAISTTTLLYDWLI